jgi:quercetin dioxygenase-like cupin family protein
MQDVSTRFAKMLGTFEIDLGIKHHFSSGVYAKEMHVPAGYVVGSHAHEFDHMSMLAKGEVIVKTDNDEQHYVAPTVVTIKKGIHHEIHAITDSIWFCIHATKETDTSKIDEVLIMKEGA